MTAGGQDTAFVNLQRLRELGAGSSARVWLAVDHGRGEEVAVKDIRDDGEWGFIAFKREFRTISELVHPNLVRLYELRQNESRGWSFTMEYVDGVDFFSYCRPQGTLDVERLAHVVPQLLEALAFVHSRGVVHRDLKPSNVLVRTDGVLKLLDFGALGVAGRGDMPALVGTPQYMAPEQLRLGPASPSNDLYALGILLFEVVTGSVPFLGPVAEVVTAQLTRDPPPPAALALPTELAVVVHRLLAKDPARRATLSDLVAALPAIGARQSAMTSPSLSGRGELVGRDEVCAAALDLLRAATAGRPAVFGMVLSGPIGVGKTTVANWVADQASREEMNVLRGAGRQREMVPFNAFDGVVDGLVQKLSLRPARARATLTGTDASLVASLFPVLALELSEVAPAQHASREAAFSALARWLEAAAALLGGIAIVLDDLQWADGDSIALLDALCSRRPRRVGLLATHDSEAAYLEETLARTGALRLVVLKPLDDRATEQVVRNAAQRAGRELDPAEAVRIVRACAGNPYLAELCGLSVAATGESLDPVEVVRRRVGGLSGRELETLGVVALADGWIPLGMVAVALDATHGEVDHGLAFLADAALVRYASPRVDRIDVDDGIADLLYPAGELSSRRVDVYHDVVRMAVLQTLGDETRERLHRGLARALTEADAAPERLARHWFGARDLQRAAMYAYQAAKVAQENHAFSLAAQMYSLALEGTPSDGQAPVRKARARALEVAGRYGEAADEWRLVGDASVGEDTVEARLEEANAAFADGDPLRGRACLDEGLSLLGASGGVWSRVGSLRSGVGFLLGPQRLELAQMSGDEQSLRRATRGNQIGLTLGFYDPLSGIHWLRRAQREAAAAGAVSLVAKMERYFSYFALFGQRGEGEVPLFNRYRDSADAYDRLVSSPDAEARAMPAFLAGVRAQRQARWDDARASFDRAQSMLEAAGHGGSFAKMTLLSHRLQLEMFSEDAQGHARWLTISEEALARGAASALRVLIHIFRLVLEIRQGHRHHADRTLDTMVASWPEQPPTQQRFFLDMYVAAHARTAGRHEDARERLAHVLKRDSRFQPMRTMYAGEIATQIALAEAQAALAGSTKASPRRALRYARIATAGVEMTQAGAWRAMAFALEAAGRRGEALAALKRSRQIAEIRGQALSAAMARWHVGRLNADPSRRQKAASEASEHGFSPRALADGWDPS